MELARLFCVLMTDDLSEGFPELVQYACEMRAVVLSIYCRVVNSISVVT